MTTAYHHCTANGDKPRGKWVKYHHGYFPVIPPRLRAFLLKSAQMTLDYYMDVPRDHTWYDHLRKQKGGLAAASVGLCYTLTRINPGSGGDETCFGNWDIYEVLARFKPRKIAGDNLYWWPVPSYGTYETSIAPRIRRLRYIIRKLKSDEVI